MNEFVTNLAQDVRKSRLKSFLQAVGSHTEAKYRSIQEKHRTLISERQETFVFQLIMLGAVAASAMLLGLVELISPNLFSFPYLKWSFDFSPIIHFWPLFLWGFLLSLFLGERVYSSHLDGELLRWGLITGNTAALWEELGYRGVFIAFGMLSVAFANWFFSFGLGWLLIGGAVFYTLVIWAKDEWDNWFLVIPIGVAVVSGVFLTHSDPMYWLYREIFMPVLNFASFDSFTEITTNTSLHEPLFVMGAIAANSWFRDGHKYQGWFGVLDAWMIGFVSLYATMTYGLLISILLHSIWNTQVYLIRFAKRKIAT